MKNKSLKVNTMLNTFRMVLTVLMPLVTFPYTSRIFLTEGNGQLNFSTSVVQIFTLFASLGIYTYGAREGTKLRDSKATFSKFAKELLVINGIATIITYIVFLSCVFMVPAFANYKVLLLINGISIGFTALGFDWVYGVYEEYVYITVRQIIVQIFTIIVMFIFVHDMSDIYLWASLLVLSSTGANIFNCINARKYIDFRFDGFKPLNIKPHVKPIIILFATQLAAKVYLNIDSVLLGIQSTDHHVGLYSAAVKLNTILITSFTAMTPVFVPRIVESLKTQNREEYIKLLKSIITLILMFALPTVVGMEMIGGELITLIAGQAFSEAIPTIRILAPIILITSLANIVYYNILVPNGKERIVLTCTMLGALINLIISILLIPTYHENGAAIGSIISEFAALLFGAVYVVKHDPGLLKSVPRISSYLFGTLSIVLWCTFVKNFFDNFIIVILLGIAGSSFFYFGALLLTKNEAVYEITNLIRNKLKKS